MSSFAEGMVFGPHRVFRGFRNNTNLTCSVGSLVAFDLLSRADSTSAVLGTGRGQAGDFYGLTSYENPSAFVTGYDAMLSRTDTLRNLSFGCVVNTQVPGVTVGWAQVWGRHSAALLIGTTSAQALAATNSALVPAFSDYYAAADAAYSAHLGRLESLIGIPGSTNASIASWALQPYAVNLARPTLGSTVGDNTASYSVAQVFLRFMM